MTQEVKVVLIASSSVAAKFEIVVGEHRVLVGFHDADIVAHGWEPHDQPHPAAYLPHKRVDMWRVPAGAGEILVSRFALGAAGAGLETERACRLANESQLHEADAEIGRLREQVAALSRIVRRTLACGQLEKLEDARPYLDGA